MAQGAHKTRKKAGTITPVITADLDFFDAKTSGEHEYTRISMQLAPKQNIYIPYFGGTHPQARAGCGFAALQQA